MHVGDGRHSLDQRRQLVEMRGKHAERVELRSDMPVEGKQIMEMSGTERVDLRCDMPVRRKAN